MHRRLNEVSKPRTAPAAAAQTTRADAVADALGSVRAEGLDPRRAEPLLDAWARGELTDAQLDELSIRLLDDPRLTAEELLSGARAA